MILSLAVGVIMVIIGITVVIPSAGLFGVLWTLVAAGITVANALPLFSDKEEYYGGMTIEDDGEAPRQGGAGRSSLPQGG